MSLRKSPSGTKQNSSRIRVSEQNFPTANLRYGQNLAAVSTNVREFVSGLILAVAVRENVLEPLKLGLISGYFSSRIYPGLTSSPGLEVE